MEQPGFDTSAEASNIQSNSVEVVVEVEVPEGGVILTACDQENPLPDLNSTLPDLNSTMIASAGR